MKKNEVTLESTLTCPECNHSKMETKYDQFSSVHYDDYKKLIERIDNYRAVFQEQFINERESAYLEKSMQIPFLKNDLKEGDLVSFDFDLEFKRTDKKGLNVREIKELLKSHHILNKDKKAGFYTSLLYV